MPSLKKLQESFSNAIFENKNEPLFSNIKNSHIDNADRIKIYQDNVLITLHDTLKNRYEAICKLVGEQFFKYVTNQYIKANKPDSGNLDDYGHNFADFISNIPQLKDYQYLKDVAKLEWALHASYFSPDSQPIDRDKLSKVPTDNLDKIKFKLHPSSYLISSDYPIYKIWEVSQDNYDGELNIDIRSGGVDILVVRPEYKINTIILEKGEYRFLTYLKNGKNLEEAFENACKDNTQFDVGTALQKFVLNGTFVDFYF
ncbi:MAG: hypothetical protein COV35_03320 [Alphaproteobacteria bacterium CG11_big_fil_rev_8_21_14_0_20_39_49]|nr:MAG: hypothetical protein COV35_03320 [Alphaproteobacteria bacterium CG11_big_fil_rev_8_21_14_0_20_39_49]